MNFQLGASAKYQCGCSVLRTEFVRVAGTAKAVPKIVQWCETSAGGQEVGRLMFHFFCCVAQCGTSGTRARFTKHWSTSVRPVQYESFELS